MWWVMVGVAFALLVRGPGVWVYPVAQVRFFFLLYIFIVLWWVVSYSNRQFVVQW